MSQQMNQGKKDVEVLTFRKGSQYAMVVTDGQQIRSFTLQDCTAHSSTFRAISFLEARGYSIVMDVFNNQ